jgi:hypothetical protein
VNFDDICRFRLTGTALASYEERRDKSDDKHPSRARNSSGEASREVHELRVHGRVREAD